MYFFVYIKHNTSLKNRKTIPIYRQLIMLAPSNKAVSNNDFTVQTKSEQKCTEGSFA